MAIGRVGRSSVQTGKSEIRHPLLTFTFESSPKSASQPPDPLNGGTASRIMR